MKKATSGAVVYKKITITLLIYEGKYLGDSMILNLIEKKIFVKVQKIAEIDLEFIMLLKGSLPSKMYNYGSILPISYILYLT